MTFPHWVKTGARVLVSAGLLAAALWLLDWENLKGAILDVSPWVFALAVGALLLMSLILGVRWHVMIAPLVEISFAANMKRYLEATFMNSFTPANLGGDVYRYVALKRHAKGNASLAAFLVLERAVGASGYAVFYLVCLTPAWVALSPDALAAKSAFALGGMAFAGGLSGLVLVVWLGRGAKRLAVLGKFPFALDMVQRLTEAAGLLVARRLVLVALLSLGGSALWVMILALVAWDLGVSVSWSTMALVGTLVEFARWIPISIQGVGVREGLFAYFFGLLGLPAEYGLVLGGVSYLAVTVSLVGAGLIGAVLPAPRRAA